MLECDEQHTLYYNYTFVVGAHSFITFEKDIFDIQNIPKSINGK